MHVLATPSGVWPARSMLAETIMRVLRGRVRSGVGDFGRWIALFREHYRRLTGLTLYPGTLNVELSEEFTTPADAPRHAKQSPAGNVIGHHARVTDGILPPT